jgi:hypothetical protein
MVDGAVRCELVSSVQHILLLWRQRGIDRCLKIQLHAVFGGFAAKAKQDRSNGVAEDAFALKTRLQLVFAKRVTPVRV